MPLTSIQALRCRYLEQTVEFVSRYDGFYPPHAASLKVKAGEGVIEGLPTIDREIVQRRPEDFFCRTDLPCTLYFTGATGGNPLSLFRSAVEQEALAAMLAALFGPATPRAYSTLALEGFFHGETLRSPIEHAFTAPLIAPAHYKTAIEFLHRGLPSPAGDRPVETLRMSTLSAKALYVFAIENGLDFGDTLRNLVTTSSHLTGHWKDRIRSFAGCDVRSTFGLTEFCEGVAWECLACSKLHFPPSVFPQIDGEEIGELILSSLYPFSQVQMFLRYRTGDILRKHEVCSLYHDHGYSFIGRRKDCAEVLDEQGRQTWLSPVAVAEALDALDVGRHAEHADLRDKLSSTTPGRRLFEIETRAGVPGIVIIARLDEGDPAEISDLILKHNFALTGRRIRTDPGVTVRNVRSVGSPATY